MGRVARTTALLATLLVCAMGCKDSTKLPAAHQPAPPPPQTHTVRIEDMKFTPATLTVRSGDTVVWQNDDLVPHNVMGGAFSSPTLAAGQSFQWKADRTGNLPYVCTLHPGMAGSLTVQ